MTLTVIFHHLFEDHIFILIFFFLVLFLLFLCVIVSLLMLTELLLVDHLIFLIVLEAYCDIEGVYAIIVKLSFAIGRNYVKYLTTGRPLDSPDFLTLYLEAFSGGQVYEAPNMTGTNVVSFGTLRKKLFKGFNFSSIRIILNSNPLVSAISKFYLHVVVRTVL